jgi:hypothetical protein
MENAQFPKNEEPSALNSADSMVDANTSPTFTLRQTRVLEALLLAESWISRESVDRIAGASNGPQIILELRRKVTGQDGIEMQKADAIDRDGRACKPGRYRLTTLGRQRVLGMPMPSTKEAV